MDMPHSCRSMWVLLSGSTVLKSEDFITKTLEQNSDKILKGILFYQTVSQVNRQTETDSVRQKYPEIPVEMIEKTTSSLNVGPKQAADLFLSFLSYGYTGSSKSIATCFTCEKKKSALISDLLDFYFDERLFSLFCLKEIISNYGDSKHPYKNMFADFVQKMDATAVSKWLIQQLHSLSLSLTSREMVYDTQTKWFEQFTRERFELTQLLILLYSQIQPQTAQVVELMQIFETMKFLNCRHYAPPDHKVSDILQVLPLLESILLVQCLRVDQVHESMQNDENCLLFADVKSVKQLDQMIRERGLNHPSTGLLHLAWALVRSFQTSCFTAEESEEVVKLLGSSALNSEVFQVVTNFLKSEFHLKFMASSKVGSYIRVAVASLLNVTFGIFNMEKLVGKRLPSLLRLAELLFKEPAVAEMADDESGLFSIMKSASLSLSRDPLPFLRLAGSFCSTPSCRQFLLYASELRSFVENVPSNSPHVIWLPEENCYSSRIDRVAYIANSAIHLRRDDMAQVIAFNSESGTMDLVWFDVSFSAFAVMRDMYRHKLDYVSSGRFNYPLDEEKLESVELIHDLCRNILTSENSGKVPYEVKEIIKLTIEGVKLLTRLPRCPRLYAATALQLISAYVDVNKREALNIWNFVKEISLFPYVSGATKDVSLIVKGNQISSGEIGRILVEDEFTSSTYDLCIAFLNFINLFLDLIEHDVTILASIAFIFTEIFPIYQLWHFKHSEQKAKVGYLCFSIAQKILFAAEGRKGVAAQIVKFTETAILSETAGTTLLKTLKSGCERVAAEIRATGLETSLWHYNVYTVRLALSVLNQLLKMRETVKKSTDDESSLSVVEKAFITSHQTLSRVRPGVSDEDTNMLIVLTGYVYQPFDFRLTVLALQTLRRLAKSFPMSMLACLGSYAESVKEHILFRLESLTEDIRVKVSLLDFLSACVHYQPGLMEMFINIDSDESRPEDENNSVLQVVLDTLREKKEAKFYCPSELHIAAVRFLATFWINSNTLTISCLKKCGDFWSLICFPLFPDENSQSGIEITAQLFAAILKLISRELFFRANDREPVDQALDIRLQKHLVSRLDQITSFLREKSLTGKIEKGDDICLLFSAWRDLLSTLTKQEFVSIEPAMKQRIFMNSLDCLKQQMDLRSDHSVLIIIAECTLITFKKWYPKILDCFDEWIEMMHELVCLTNERKDEWGLELVTTIHIFLIQSIRSISEVEERKKHLISWIQPLASLLRHATQMMERVTFEEREERFQAPSRRLMTVSLSLFNCLITSIADKAESWITILRSFNLIESLACLISQLIQRRKDPELPSNLILLFLAFSTIDPVAEALVTSSSENMVWVSLVMKSEPSEAFETTSQKRGWDNVYVLTIRFLTSLLASRSQFFVRDMLQLMTGNLDRITSCLRTFRTAPSTEVLEEAVEVSKLIRLLSRFRNYWCTAFPLSFEVMMAESSLTAYSAAGFVVRPNLFAYMMQHPQTQKSLYKAMMTRVNAVPVSQSSTQATLQSPIKGLDSGLTPTSLDEIVENQLNLVLCLSTQTLAALLPPLTEVLDHRRLAVRDPLAFHRKPLRPHLTPHFTTPAVDSDHFSSYGSVLQLISLFVRKEQRPASSDSPVSTTHRKTDACRLPHAVILSTIESGLCLLVSQALVAQTDPNVKPSDKQFIAGELKSELHTILSPLARTSKRTSSSHFSSSSSSPTHSFADHPLIKFLVHDLVENME